jgi:hypothetical protein
MAANCFELFIPTGSGSQLGHSYLYAIYFWFISALPLFVLDIRSCSYPF